MTLFLGLCVGLSLTLILLGYLMDRGGILGRVNGANGLPILVAVIVSFLFSLVVALIAGIFGGWAMLGWILLLTLPYHLGLFAFLVWRLQSLATRVAKADRGE
ncbi:MAG: hypothetical protein ACLGIE_15245 [Alphaproteobacteria bacterium]